MHKSSKQFGELDIKLKNNIFGSFRFEIIIYSLLSLFYTLLSEAGIFLIFYGVNRLLNLISESRIIEHENINNKIYYGASIPTVVEPRMSLGEFSLLCVFATVLGIFLFITYFLMLTKKSANYLDEIAIGIDQISAGNFDTRIDIKNEDEFTLIASRINKMADDIKRIMENERKVECIKNDLITSVAHDLRTPLTSIIGYLELASTSEEISIDTMKKYIAITYDKSKRLEKLIEDLFAYTKFSSGEVNMNPCEVDMVKFLEQIIEEFYPSFQESELEYEFQTSHSAAYILGDGDLLARAFANLISNAVKYGKDGKKIKIKLIKMANHVIIDVINYGELIPEKDIENIFDRFYRVETSRSRATGGSGLGLAIAKNIIKMHDGTITAKSDFRGTVFEVKLNKHEPASMEGKQQSSTITKP